MATVLEPRLDEPGSLHGDRWMLVIFNNPVTDYDLVVETLCRATGCEPMEAEIEAWEAHHHGSAPVHFASVSAKLAEPARILNRIGVVTEIRPEFVS